MNRGRRARTVGFFHNRGGFGPVGFRVLPPRGGSRFEGQVLVADNRNARVQVSIRRRTCRDGASLVFPQRGLSQPVAIAVSPEDGTFWVADTAQNHLLSFPSINQLPRKLRPSDATLRRQSPPGLDWVDQNLTTCSFTDGINRVLYFGASDRPS